jgi:hypothetical protein
LRKAFSLDPVLVEDALHDACLANLREREAFRRLIAQYPRTASS